ncbi:hypothetical protein ABZV60_16850 [Streptomyces sp. NPDC004787]|uniref:hypothetical protein n=1 Tax=Streptomyces sp. NPDC004787 TaxID=3154291 RepID=UPI0033A90F3A
MTARPAIELRDLFTQTACSVMPSPVPLAAMMTAGQTARRRRTAGWATAAGLLLAPLAITALRLSPQSAAPSAAAGTVHTARVLAPGERVEAASEAELWLTRDGMHWSTPAQTDQFRGISREPGLTLQAETTSGRFLLSGTYRARGDAATVHISTTTGTVTGEVVRLAGQPGWGAWYASSPLLDANAATDFKSLIHDITIRDAAGRTLARAVISPKS